MAITEDEVRARLAAEVRAAGSQKAWADRAQISEVYLSDALRGRRPIGEKILRALGLTRRNVYSSEVSGDEA